MNLEQYDKAFTEEGVARLRSALYDLSWLQGRGYTLESCLKLTGDRHGLNKPLREALKRSSCAPSVREARAARELSPQALKEAEVWIDGFNLLITVERALRGDPVLISLDGVVRDIAGVHGTYRKGGNTLAAFKLLSEALSVLGVSEVTWLFDRPVSNSGRAAEMARAYGRAEVVDDPDKELVAAPEHVVVVSGDGVILEGCSRWFNLARFTLESLPLSSRPAHSALGGVQPLPWLIDLSLLEPPSV